MEEVILAVDIGSSSVRCVAYQRSTTHGDNRDRVTQIDDCSVSIKIKSIEPNTGKIRRLLLREEDQEEEEEEDSDDNNEEKTSSSSLCLLLDCVDSVVDTILNKLRSSYSKQQQEQKQEYRIVGIGFSCFVMNLVAIDDKGKILGSDFSISYACNTTDVAKECQLIRKELQQRQHQHQQDSDYNNNNNNNDQQQQIRNNKEDLIYQKTGSPIHNAYALPQLRVLYKNHPIESLQRIYKWQTIPSLILARWTGQKFLPISYSEASWTGLLNFKDCKYEPMMMDLLPKECVTSLPPLTDYNEAIMGLPKHQLEKQPNNEGGDEKTAASETTTTTKINPYWKKWPELRQTPMLLGIGDGACANIGSKCCSKSRIAVTIGTSAASRICIPQQGIAAQCTIKVLPKGLFCYRIDRHNLLLGGALTDGGSAIEWARELLNLKDETEFSACINQVEELYYHSKIIDDNNEAQHDDNDESINTTKQLTMLPFFSGERSTGYRSGATGAIMGLTLTTKPADIIKSSLESVSLRLRAIISLLQDTIQESSSSEASSSDATSPPSILVSGGALESSSLWRQMIADSTGLHVILDLDTTEGTSRGVARLVSNALNGMSTTSQQQQQQQQGVLSEEEIVNCQESTPNRQARTYFDKAATNQEAFLKAMSPLYMQSDLDKI